MYVQNRALVSKSERLCPKASTYVQKQVTASNSSACVCILRATHAHAHAQIPALAVHVHVRRTRGQRGDEVGGLLLRRPMIEQGAVSTCACAL